MKELFEQIEQTKEHLDGVLASNKTISLLQETMRHVYKQKFDDWDENDISEALLKLVTLLYGLSPLIEHSKMAYNISYGYRKFKGASRYLEFDSGETVAQKNALVDKYIKSIRDEEIFNSYMSESLRRMHDDISRTVSVLQTILKVKTNEHFSVNTQT